jgi:hypothetical protein
VPSAPSAFRVRQLCVGRKVCKHVVITECLCAWPLQKTSFSRNWRSSATWATSHRSSSRPHSSMGAQLTAVRCSTAVPASAPTHHQTVRASAYADTGATQQGAVACYHLLKPACMVGHSRVSSCHAGMAFKAGNGKDAAQGMLRWRLHDKCGPVKHESTVCSCLPPLQRLTLCLFYGRLVGCHLLVATLHLKAKAGAANDEIRYSQVSAAVGCHIV